MTLPKVLTDREYQKFIETPSGDVALRVANSETSTPVDILGGTPYELTASFADVGAEQDVTTSEYVTLWFNIDIGTSVDPQIRILYKHTSAGTDEYRDITQGTPTSNLIALDLNDYELGADADQKFKLTIPVIGVNYIQIQAKDDANGDGQIDSLYITKS